MITKLRNGTYRLFESKGQTKIITLDKDTFAWVNVAGIGEILVSSQREHPIDCVLSIGQYVIYLVKDEPKLVDQMHLELHVGNNVWQGYLLPTGLPEGTKKRNRIIPTPEIITKGWGKYIP